MGLNFRGLRNCLRRNQTSQFKAANGGSYCLYRTELRSTHANIAAFGVSKTALTCGTKTCDLWY